MLDQFLYGVPEDLRVWLKERRPGSLHQAMKQADDYALTCGGRRPTQQRYSGRGTPPVTQSVGKPVEDKVPQAPQSQLPTLGGLERSRTTSRGEKPYFQCGTFGHIAVNCPSCGESSTATRTTKGLYAAAGHCDEVAWNARSRKYLRCGTLEGCPVRILVDTACDRTMISAGQVPSSKVDLSTVMPVLYVHGYTMQYPTTWVELWLGQSKRRQMEREFAGAPEGPTAHSSGEVLPTPRADPQPESEGGGNQLQGPEVEDEAGEDSEAPLPLGGGTESRVMTGSETGGSDDAVTRGPL